MGGGLLTLTFKLFFNGDQRPPPHHHPAEIFWIEHSHSDSLGRVIKLGDFFNVLGNKLAYKSSPKGLLIFGLFWKRSIYVRTGVDNILATFGNIWPFFNPASGHTVPSSPAPTTTCSFEVLMFCFWSEKIPSKNVKFWRVTNYYNGPPFWQGKLCNFSVHKFKARDL